MRREIIVAAVVFVSAVNAQAAPPTLADAVAARAAAQAEVDAAVAEYAAAVAGGENAFYLRGSVGWLNWTPESMANGDVALAADNYWLAVFNFDNAKGKAAASRRWTAAAVRAP